MITILKPAVQTTVQDLGRKGLRHLGVGRAGAMDRLSLTVGNYLVGNAGDAAGRPGFRKVASRPSRLAVSATQDSSPSGCPRLTLCRNCARSGAPLD